MREVMACLFVAVLALGLVVGCGMVERAEEAEVPVEEVVAPMGQPGEITLQGVRDAKFGSHSIQLTQNFGAANRLRTKGIQAGHCEIVLIDFDRSELRRFVEARRGRKLSGELEMHVYEIDRPQADIHVATLQTASEWEEGQTSFDQAQRGESCYTWARYQVERWKTQDGAEVENLRDLFYDLNADEVKTIENSHSPTVRDGDRTVTIQLDEKVIKDLALNENCRGLILFNRHPEARLDFYSRRQANRRYSLKVVAE